jgi:Uma2 family endonuclease
MAQPARPRATYQDALNAPPHLVAELIEGALYTHPRPATRHALAAMALSEELGPPFRRGRGGPGGWVLLPEPELHLRGDVLVPDLAGWRRERMPELPDAPFLELAPDWVCEIVSASTEALDRGLKMSVYGREGVPFAWLVDPVERLLEAYQSEGGRWRPTGSWRGEAKVAARPFEAVAFELSVLWEH